MTESILALPSANCAPTAPPDSPSLRARFLRRMKARLRGTPMSTFTAEGPQGRFVLVRDRSGQRSPLLLLSGSDNEGVSHRDLAQALAITPKAHLIQGAWRRRGDTVSFRADNSHLQIKELHALLERAGTEYGVLLLLPHAA